MGNKIEVMKTLQLDSNEYLHTGTKFKIVSVGVDLSEGLLLASLTYTIVAYEGMRGTYTINQDELENFKEVI